MADPFYQQKQKKPYYTLGRKSGYNCTNCYAFYNLRMLTDTEDVKYYENVTWVDCGHYGLNYCNNFLIPCKFFKLDETKPEIVYIDTKVSNNRIRHYRRISELRESEDLEQRIYDIVVQVERIDSRGYLYEIAIKRIAQVTEKSIEIIQEQIDKMVSSGVLRIRKDMDIAFIKIHNKPYSIELVKQGRRGYKNG